MWAKLLLINLTLTTGFWLLAMNAVTVPSSDTNNVGNKWYSKIKATTKWNDVNTTVIGHDINFGSRNKGHYVWITGLTARLVNFAIFFRHEIDSSQYLQILRVSDLTRFFLPWVPSRGRVWVKIRVRVNLSWVWIKQSKETQIQPVFSPN